MTRRTKVLVGAGTVVVALAVVAVVAYANLTRIVKAVLEEQVPGLTFEKLDVGWNDVSVTGVSLKRKDRVVFKVDGLRVRPSLWSIFSDTLHVASVDIDGPYVYVVRGADGSLTLPMPEGMERSEPKEKKEKKEDGSSSMGLFIERIRIRDGKGDFVDRSVHGSPAKLTLSKLDVSVEKVAVPSRDEPIPFDLSVQLAGKRTGKLELDGWYNAKSQAAELELELRSLFLPHAEPYYRSKNTTASLSDGTLDLDTDLELKEGRYVADNRLELSEVAFSRDGLFLGVPVALFQQHLRDQGKPFVVEARLEGSLKDKSGLQQQLVAAVVKALAKELGEKALLNVAKDLEQGEVGKSVKDGAGKALDSLFGR